MEFEIATREEWLQQRKALLRDEKALIRFKDYLAERRRALPWVPIDKDYQFTTNDGPRSLADLFQDKGQLIVYHFMFGPDWDAGCPGCSQVADTFALSLPHIESRDVTLVAVSRAPLSKLNAVQADKGWAFPWVSAADSDFNIDFHASAALDEQSGPDWELQPVGFDRSENHGISVFTKVDGVIYHTYSCYERAVELMMVHWQYLDLCPQGREVN